MTSRILPGATFREKLMTFVATGFGLGILAPFASGTFGSLPGVLLAIGLSFLPWFVQLPIALAFAAAAVPFCSVAERVFGIKDDGRIVADEWMLFPLAVIGLPILAAWWYLPVFFVVTRAFDIVKLPPANRLQAIPGGLGIVIDDFVSNLYSLLANWAIFLLVRHFAVSV